MSAQPTTKIGHLFSSHLLADSFPSALFQLSVRLRNYARQSVESLNHGSIHRLATVATLVIRSSGFSSIGGRSPILLNLGLRLPQNSRYAKQRTLRKTSRQTRPAILS